MFIQSRAVATERVRASAIAALMTAALAIPLAAPASADDDHRGDGAGGRPPQAEYRHDNGANYRHNNGADYRHDNRADVRHDEQWRRQPQGDYYQPPVVYAPPPVYYGQAPGLSLNFAFPLR